MDKGCVNCKYSEEVHMRCVDFHQCTRSIPDWLECRKNDYKLWEAVETSTER